MMSPDEAIEILEELPERLWTYEAEYLWEDERITEAIMIAVECLKEKCHE